MFSDTARQLLGYHGIRSIDASEVEDELRKQAVVVADSAEPEFVAVQVTDQPAGDGQRVVEVVRCLQSLHGPVAPVQAVGKSKKRQIQRLLEEPSVQAQSALKVGAAQVVQSIP